MTYQVLLFLTYWAWSIYRARKVDQATAKMVSELQAVLSQQSNMERRIDEVEATLQASPFVTFPTPYKYTNNSR
jgi:hypothetical protein